jgi:hypothetical protein
MAEVPKPRAHGLAIQEGCTRKVPEAGKFEYKVWTLKCDCGVTYNIFVDIPHYTSGQQFSNYVEKVLKMDHDNKRTHPDYINLPMEAEFTA